jgi:hypothetical protein
MAVIPRSWWFMTGERVFALDNRCPHMGFPLDRGTVEDGILTCHWHPRALRSCERYRLSLLKTAARARERCN